MHPHLMSPFYECVFGDPVATTCGVDKDGLELDFGSLKLYHQNLTENPSIPWVSKSNADAAVITPQN